MVKIYCIEDINDLQYVGSTTRLLRQRLAEHRYNKKRGKNVQASSTKLNLEYCIIYLLEECSEEDRYEKEKYWIDKLVSVNIINPIGTRKDAWTKYNNKKKIKRPYSEIV
tara:strand:+ start:100 stop:429 length:330 start_codon:yes stop_codon:yes gene_type:complete